MTNNAALPHEDALIYALAASICDLLAGQILESRAIVKALEAKGSLSFQEWQRAKAEIPPASAANLAETLGEQLQQRMAERLRGLSDGTIQ